MKKNVYLLLTLFIINFLSSCATILRGKNPNKIITINSKPSNATIRINGDVIGQTPFKYILKNRKSKFVQISKEGFEDYNTEIERKLSPGWTIASFVCGAFGFFIPTAIDFACNSVRTFKTEKIDCDLKELNPNINKINNQNFFTSEESNLLKKGDSSLGFEGKINAQKLDFNGESINNSIISLDAIQKEPLDNPKLRIRTGTREFFLGYKSCVSITSKNGIKIRSNIKEIEKNYLILAKYNTKIYFKDIEKIRMFSTRRWFPIITIFSVIPPIIWFASSKLTSVQSSDCRKKINEIKIINRYNMFKYGKDRCK